MTEDDEKRTITALRSVATSINNARRSVRARRKMLASEKAMTLAELGQGLDAVEAAIAILPAYRQANLTLVRIAEICEDGERSGADRLDVIYELASGRMTLSQSESACPAKSETRSS